MKKTTKVLSLVLVLCMIIPMCLIHISADAVEKTTDPGIKFWSETISGNFAGKSNTLNWAAAYKAGTADILPLTWKGTGGTIRYNYNVNGEPWSGMQTAKNTYGIDNWFIAFMIRNPGEGSFTVSFDMLKMSTTPSEVSVYAIASQGSDAFKKLYNSYAFDMADAAAVNPYLMEAQQLISETVKGGTLATKLGTIAPTSDMKNYTTYEVVMGNALQSKASDGDYIIVLVPEADPDGGTSANCNIYLEGMNVSKSEGGAPSPSTPTSTTPTTPVVSDSSYSLFHSSLTGLTYDANGGVGLSACQDALNALYASGEMSVVPYAVGSQAPAFLNYGPTDTTGNFGFNGLKLQKAHFGDWLAVKFRSPGAGCYSIQLEYYYLNPNNAGTFTTYLLPSDTSAADIGALLVDDNKLSSFEVLQNSENNKTLRSASCSTGQTLEADKDYILVILLAKDAHEPETGRMDLMLTGLTFGQGYEKQDGAFNPVSGEIVAEELIKSAEAYRAICGKNPANGHDLLYLLFKGKTMLVYDVTKGEIIDQEFETHSTPFGYCFDPEGNLWLCGAGAFILKYDPRTGDSTKYGFAYSLFGGNKTNAYGILYGDDGYLYFTYWGWIGRLDPQTGEIINLSGTQLTVDPSIASDAQFAAHCGMIYKDGFLYMNIFGDLNGDKVKTSYLIKYDIANRKIVDYIDILDTTLTSSYGLKRLNLLGNLLVGNQNSREVPVYIDISGDKMVRLEKLDGFDSNFVGEATSAVNGKVYLTGYVDHEGSARSIYEYDLETKQIKRLSEIVLIANLSVAGGIVTVENDEKLPGISLVTIQNNTATGMVDVILYNPQTNETVIRSGVTEGYGSGMHLIPLETDPTGRYIYAGSYGNNQIARYDVETGDILIKPGYSHQTDSLGWYQGALWMGNYNTGSVTRFDPETYDRTPLYNLMDTVFQQKRMYSVFGADNKIFCATVPDTSRIGGSLTWYDMETDLTYVAVGPEAKDVYYARTTGSFTVWRDVLTDTIQTFDVDGDGLYDFDFILDDKGDDDPSNDVKEQRFYGVIPNQCINHMFYKDGYIIGTTTRSNGQAAPMSEENAQLFIYDLAAMKVVSLYDVADSIQGLENSDTGMIDYIDIFREDPYETGKYWGVINDTLFSCSIDFETMQFTNFKEELSMAKGRRYRHRGSAWLARKMIFDGDYMYVCFHNYGTMMISTADPSVNYQISELAAADMVLASDGNLYYNTNHSNTEDDLTVFRVAQYTQPLVAKSVQALINALPETVTADDETQIMTAYAMYNDLKAAAKELVDATKLNAAVAELENQQAAKADSLIDAIGKVNKKSGPAIQAARSYYDSLSDTVKAKVTKLSVLEAAEAKFAKLSNSNATVIILAVAAVVIVGAAVTVIVIRKKKSSAEE